MFSLQEEELASWDDWGKNDADLVSIKVESPRGQAEQQQEEIDLFGDMQPVFQKPKKVFDLILMDKQIIKKSMFVFCYEQFWFLFRFV